MTIEVNDDAPVGVAMIGGPLLLAVTETNWFWLSPEAEALMCGVPVEAVRQVPHDADAPELWLHQARERRRKALAEHEGDSEMGVYTDLLIVLRYWAAKDLGADVELVPFNRPDAERFAWGAV
jgi:hypothetical protein